MIEQVHGQHTEEELYSASALEAKFGLDAAQVNQEQIDFAALLGLSRKLKAEKDKGRTPNCSLTREFTRLLAKANVVSFDIFDTALLRYVEHPTDVFLHLERSPAFREHPFKSSVAYARIEAERQARNLVFKLIGSFEVNLLEIYQIFCDLHGISREFAPGFVEAEEAIELDLCLPCQEIKELFDSVRAVGKRPIFISDTYHRTDFLHRLVNHHGYAIERSSVFGSAEVRKSKQSGDLFPLVMQELRLSAETMLHVGDHPVSDFASPKRLGIQAILHARKACCEVPVLLNGLGARTLEQDRVGSKVSAVRGMVRAKSQASAAHGFKGDFWWEFGYSSLGPLTAGFCEWLEQRLREDGMEHAYFLLRDGEVLAKVYELLYRNKPGAVPASTLDSSRRAMVLPTVDLAPSFALPCLLAGIGKRPLGEYLERFDIDPTPFLAEAIEAGFSSLDDRVEGLNVEDFDRITAFLVKPRVLNALLDRCQAERETLLSFLQQTEVVRRSRVAVVDLGWGGTIQKGMHALLARTNPETKLTGYYLATFPKVDRDCFPGVEFRSYLTDRGRPEAAYRTINDFLNLFETAFTSARGSLLYFSSTPASSAGERPPLTPHSPGKPVRAVYQALDKSSEQCRQLELMHQGILAFAADYRRRRLDVLGMPLPPEVASEEIFRVIRKPDVMESRLLGGLVHCDNLGSSSTHISAQLDDQRDAAALYDQYQHIPWKQGALRLGTPAAARLNVLMWLLELQEGDAGLLNQQAGTN
jgi:FMN phosphatase YigB (HAD superfamily)